MRTMATLSVVSVLSGCAMPIPIQVASWLMDGVSLVATEKTLPDHALSAMLEQDCAMWRVVPDGDVCRDQSADDAPATGEMVAQTAPTADLAPEPELLADNELDGMVTAAGVPPDSMPEPKPEASGFYVVTRDVNVRDAPSARGTVILPLLARARVTVLDQREGWLLVDLSPRDTSRPVRGWVDGRFLHEANG